MAEQREYIGGSGQRTLESYESELVAALKEKEDLVRRYNNGENFLLNHMNEIDERVRKIREAEAQLRGEGI